MKQTIPFALILVGLTACFGPRITLELASKDEGIPFPRFSAQDVTNEGALPVYSDIKVYDVTDDCTVPECRLMWHLTVSDTASPTNFTYGAFPSFGSTTVVSPKRLQPNKKYRLVVDQAQNTNPSDYGYLDFQVADDGRIVAEEKE